MAPIATQAYVAESRADTTVLQKAPPHDSPPREGPPDDEPNLIAPLSSIERELDEWEVRNGVGLNRVPEQESGRVKTGFVGEWLRTDQGKALPASTRDLIRELLDIAGPEHHRYTTDARQCVAVIWAGQRYIADRLGMTVAGVRSRMRAAAKAGLINRTKRPYGRSSLTVVELTLPAAAAVLADVQKVPNAGQSKRSDSRRALKLHPSVRGSSIPQCVEVAPHLSDAASNCSAEMNQGDSHSDSSLGELSPKAAKPETTEQPATRTAHPKAPPTLAQLATVRDALQSMGVSERGAARMLTTQDYYVVASVVAVMIRVRTQRPDSRQAKSKAVMGAWIGSILFKGKKLDAWIATELKRDKIMDRAIEHLQDAGMIAGT